jgi:hypothetical protein
VQSTAAPASTSGTTACALARRQCTQRSAKQTGGAPAERGANDVICLYKRPRQHVRPPARPG